MCITKAAKVISLESDEAKVRFLDSGTVRNVNVSLVHAKEGSYVEVFADHAISKISKEEARRKTAFLLQVIQTNRG